MNRLKLIGTFLLAFSTLVSACAPLQQEMTPIVSTAIPGTVEPILLTELPPDYTPPPTPVPPSPTYIPTIPAGLSPTQLKYRVLSEFPDFFYCDPDYYPVARADEMELALERFPELQANSEEFAAILAHNNLEGLSTYTDEQKLLIYQEHKKLAAIPFELKESGYAFQIQVAESEGRGELVSGVVDSQGKITVQERTTSIATCPICLAGGTLIDTPDGPRPVEDLRLGTLVWTVDNAGKRVAQPVIRLGKTIVPSNHRVVRLVLEDGRQLWVSPGHPTVDGGQVGQLKSGDILSGDIHGAQIRSAEWVLYPARATYDLLPAGDTGFYWANGILLASSLKEE